MKKTMSRGVRSICVLTCAWCVICCASETAFAAPGGRVYEMVSPVYKGGYGVGGVGGAISAVAPNGESLAFYSKGIFSGAPAGPTTIDYVARRSPSGWSTEALMIPASLLPQVAEQDVSSSLDSTVVLGKPGPNLQAAFQVGNEEQFWLHEIGASDTVAGWEQAGGTIKALDEEPFGGDYEGANANLCRLFLQTQQRPLLPETTEARGKVVYEVNRGCNGEPQSLQAVGLNNNRTLVTPMCEAVLGIDSRSGRESLFNDISVDGKEVFFTVSVENNVNSCGEHNQLFVRLNGEKTLEISRPISEFASCGENIPCAGAISRASADFAGASEDGSTVFFTTAAALTSEDKDGKTDLYMATIGCSSEEETCEADNKEVRSLVQVSQDTSPGQPAEVQGVARVAPDGSRVYFVARGVLGEGPNSEGQMPVRGADNLYIYDRVTGKTAFVAELCSGPGFSGPGGSLSQGAVEDLSCPLDLDVGQGARNDTSLWTGNVSETQTAGLGGRFLVFSSYGQLVGGDVDTAKDVYRYDAETGLLSRISIGEAGSDANGNNSLFDVTILPGNEGGNVREQHEMNSRAISEDGSRIVFDTDDPLSPAAVNGLRNAYEWHLEPGESEGQVSLISSGSAEEPVSDVVIAPEGTDVFFVTTQDLVSQDKDGAPDVYDARLLRYGGFPEPPVLPQPCAGDACQGPLTNPAPLLVPGSISDTPGENLPAPKPVSASKVKKKPGAHAKKKKLKVKSKGKKKSAARRAVHSSKSGRDADRHRRGSGL